MKRFVALFLLLGSLFLLTSCGEEEYKPVESSELEISVVMTLTVEENTYEQDKIKERIAKLSLGIGVISRSNASSPS